MDKSIIDKMNKEEVLELLSPYLNAGDSGIQYYMTLREYDIKLDLTEDKKYTKGRINIYTKGMLYTYAHGETIDKDNWTEVGAVGPAIYPEIVSKYRDMTINKIINDSK